MHKEILTNEQLKLLPIVKLFSKKFGLVGGTAIALHCGHRRSIDFDLFSFDALNSFAIKTKIIKTQTIDKVLVNKKEEYTVLIKGVKFTFFQFPYQLHYVKYFENIITLPDILTLAAMKAFALGRRAKWKDYVDLYFILKSHHTIGEITAKGKKIFGNEFNEKIFRTQLAYFEDMNYSEKIDFMPGHEVSEKDIQKGLIAFSLE